MPLEGSKIVSHVELRAREDLAKAFPSTMRSQALKAVATLNESRFSGRWSSFPLRFGEEQLEIPNRIYYEWSAHPLWARKMRREILDCLFTRHHDGFVRQAHLQKIISSRNPWIPCFVVPLVGEYVVEILQLIYDNIDRLDRTIYATFLRTNPDFLNLIEQRVISYWDCYYRSIRKSNYPGFLILDYFHSILEAGSTL